MTKTSEYDTSEDDQVARLYNFFMLYSSEHEIYPAHKCKMATIVGILTFISMIKLNQETSLFIGTLILGAVEISCSVELGMKKSFITSGPESQTTSQSMGLRGRGNIAYTHIKSKIRHRGY